MSRGIPVPAASRHKIEQERKKPVGRTRSTLRAVTKHTATAMRAVKSSSTDNTMLNVVLGVYSLHSGGFAKPYTKSQPQ
eukprot:6200000-Pleurochrysis_carterae.AAC.2